MNQIEETIFDSEHNKINAKLSYLVVVQLLENAYFLVRGKEMRKANIYFIAKTEKC